MSLPLAEKSNGIRGFLPTRIDHKIEEGCAALKDGDRIEVRYFVHDGADDFEEDDEDECEADELPSKRAKLEEPESATKVTNNGNSDEEPPTPADQTHQPVRIWWPCTVRVPKENSKVLRFEYDSMNVVDTDFPAESRRVMLITPRTFIDLDTGRADDRQVFRMVGEVSPPPSLCPTLDDEEEFSDEEDPAHTMAEWAEMIDHTLQHHMDLGGSGLEDADSDGNILKSDIKNDENDVDGLKTVLGGAVIDHHTKLMLASQMRGFVDALKNKLVTFAAKRSAMEPVSKEEMKTVMEELMEEMKTKRKNDNFHDEEDEEKKPNYF